MSEFKDLEGEFAAVKQCSVSELDKDNFILSLKNQKGLVRDVALQKDKQKLNYTFNIKMNRFSRRKEEDTLINLQKPTEKLTQEINEQPKPKKRRIYLVGMEELKNTLGKNQQYLDQSSQKEDEEATEDSSKSLNGKGGIQDDEPVSQPDENLRPTSSSTSSIPKKKKRQVVLIPMDPEYVLKARAALEKADANFDASQPIEVDSDSSNDQDEESDVFVDVPLKFREIEVSYDELIAVVDSTETSQVPSVGRGEDEPRELADKGTENGTEIGADGAEIHSSLQPTQEDVLLMKKIVLSQLASPIVPNIETSLLAQPSKELHSILARTLEDGESHMVLLIGPHGLGKTVITEQALSDLKRAQGDNFITIRLSGSLHSTEQHAIREIARQLDQALKNEHTTESSTFEKRAISDTFANILLTLEASIDKKSLDGAAKDQPMRVIIIIDEIEKYTDTPKQMLLYNLFDLTQNPKYPICVLGSTTKVNIRDLFEKRVRSRFSQRIITTQLADSIETFWNNASRPLRIAGDDASNFSKPSYPAEWNLYIDGLFKDKSVKGCLYQCYFTTKSIAQFKQLCMLPVNQINFESPLPNAKQFEIYLRSISEGVEAKFSSCSRLELMMVVAAARWVHRAENSQVNFNLAYNEYEQMLKAHNMESTTLLASGSAVSSSHVDSLALAGIKVTKSIYSVPIMRDCWGRIYRTGLLLDAVTSNNEMNAHNNLNMYKEIVIEDSRMLQLDILLEEIRSLVAGDPLMERLSKL